MTLNPVRFRSAGRLVALVVGCAAAALGGLGVDAQNLGRVQAAATSATTSAITPGATSATAPAPDCPARPSTAAGRDFRGRDLSFQNFAHQNLANADFRGATLKGTVFVGADLTGANFSGATTTVLPTDRPPLVTDFSFANLDSACFIGTTFGAPTYFTYATLTCTDFSTVDFGNGNAIFGRAALRLDTARCRPAFRQATMNCELVKQWKLLDLTRAIVTNCARSDLAGVDLSNAMLDGVDLYAANLEGARLDSAQLHGATLNYARLKNATLNGAQLGVGPEGRSDGLGPAYLAYVYAPGADFGNADLRTADFDHAHLYRSDKGETKFGGARCNSTNFANAVLPGVSFSGARTLTNAVFSGASLVNATFANIDLTGVKFDGALLQGVDFSGVTGITGASLAEAAISSASGGWSTTDPTGVPVTYRYAATRLGPLAKGTGASCPNGDASPCDTPGKLTPHTPPPSDGPACKPLAPNYDNCPAPQPPN